MRRKDAILAEITYFEQAGEGNTRAVLDIALARCQQGDIDAIVMASSYGDSAKLAAKVFKDSGEKLLVVGEVLDGRQSPPEDVCSELQAAGHQVIWGMPMGAMSAFTHDQSAGLVADTFRRVSEGFKVVSEIVLIAATQGFLLPGQKVLSMAGTHRGLDTAVVATAAPFTAFKNYEVNEVLCKPYRREKK